MTNIEWNKRAKNSLKAELTRKGVSYAQLVEKLKLIGVNESYNSINTKLNRGSFTFSFALQCFKAIGVEKIHLDLDNDE